MCTKAVALQFLLVYILFAAVIGGEKLAKKNYKKHNPELREDIDILANRKEMECFWEHLLS